MTPTDIIIGTRGSELALWQANYVKAALQQHHPQLRCHLRIIQTTGDRSLHTSLAQIGEVGLFTKEIQHQLLKDHIHIAVHSFKDLPTERPENLEIAALCDRRYPADVLVSKNNLTLDQLPPNAVVLTSSLRRQAQLLHRRPDLQIRSIRGNVLTRLRKFDQSDAHAVIIAHAALQRLSLTDRITEILDPADFLPAPGQGTLAVEIRSDNPQLRSIVADIDDPDSRAAATAERAVLAQLQGGCQVPIAAYAYITDDRIHLHALVSDLTGTTLIRAQDSAPIEQHLQLAQKLAQQLRDQGAQTILDQITADQPDL
ncbi:MAG: hydroxymethylbilane synthase [Sedimentisphaerales bacterium]|nr:hydroxymethylbilane synthase [Sedimentisphaerales bacterium]